MSIETSRDPRQVLTEDKHFTLRPKPLERWIWEQKIPPTAERIFWVHWEEGMRRRDWCSELALAHVARACCVDISTVTRSYQVLKRYGLVRREDPGRDPHNPFQRAITLTEVRIPRELLVTLARLPNRRTRKSQDPAPSFPALPREATDSVAGGGVNRGKTPEATRLARAAWQAVMAQLSAAERVEFFEASRDHRTAMRFDDATALDPESRAQVLAYLARQAAQPPESAPGKSGGPATPALAVSRTLAPLETARLRREVCQLVPATSASEVFRQVLWSVEEGALRRFESRHAANIALKKIRDRAWTKPNRMPPNWMVAIARVDTCSAA